MASMGTVISLSFVCMKDVNDLFLVVDFLASGIFVTT